ncbi:hypothetical protein [Arthrobacter sp. 92]|jgi:hypothetical protein|uniref:hypothetical protein n=1 Tax=Arthrobacter sp. 92 TaxID=3418175 RepID=UPI0006A906B7|nr:hypothetical protein AHiyo6_35190 [Arthrobacter sp. Hiyo6]
MTFDTDHSVTLKIWDRSTMDHTLEAAAQALSARAKTPKSAIAVTCSGPNTFTLSLKRDAPQGATFEEVTR